MTYKGIVTIGLIILLIGLTACNSQKDNLNSDQQESTSNESSNQPINNSKDNSDSEKSKEEQVRYIEINEDASITTLVNKEHNLSEDYEPEDLVSLEVPTILENPEINQLREVAADALKNMFNKALESDIHLYARSGYRSYQTQVQLFDNYAEKHGEDAANRYSARPGQSEHQTGLVMDVTSESVNFELEEEFGKTKEGKWLHKHAHEFGFIIRYPEYMEDVTGYIYEPWHIRYIGVDLASDVYESRLTYEEFLVKEGIIHEVNS